jgi:hypothetical protein
LGRTEKGADGKTRGFARKWRAMRTEKTQGFESVTRAERIALEWAERGPNMGRVWRGHRAPSSGAF